MFAVFLTVFMFVFHKIAISTIENRDDLFMEKSRYILKKLAYKKPFCNIFSPKISSKVAYEYDGNMLAGILSAKSGDTVFIKNGSFYLNGEIISEYSFETEAAIPAKFSPRDNILSFEIPKIGDRFVYTKDDIAAACFLYGIMKQVENITLEVTFFVNGEEKSDFFIDDFTLYKGMFVDIGDEMKASVYFWNAFLSWYKANVSQNATLTAEIRNFDGNVISGWQVRENYYFIIVPHRNGFDSRYAGAIAESKIAGEIGFKLPF
jgi:hypothetical protein